MAILPLIQALQYDWRNDLTRLLGDTVGGKVAQELENLYQHGRAISHGIAAQVADYVRESDAAVVGQQQLQQLAGTGNGTTGIPSGLQQVEAAAFAWLAACWYQRQPVATHHATGATGARILGCGYWA